MPWLFSYFYTVILSLKERITVRQTKVPIMRKFLAMFILGISFGEINPGRISDKALDPVNQRAESSDGVNWELEIIDSVIGTASNDFIFNTLALDYDQVPHVVYNRYEFDRWTITHASRTDSIWQKEVVDSGLFSYGPSLIFNADNIAHLSYYRKDDSLNKTYVCYARRNTAGWQVEVVDSSNGYLGNYFLNFNSSIDLDTSGLPGIAYYAWNVEDSLHYVKYAHYNGTYWDTSIVARDTTWHHRYPLDYSPSLKFDREGTPHIAFHRFRGDTDTIKIGYYDDTLDTWIISPAVCYPYGGYPVSLTLNSQDYPCIAHGLSAAVAYSWWDGLSWHTESTGTGMGWIGIRIVLDLDSLDNPHIAYLPDPMIAHPCYSYKQNGIWYNYGWIEPDSFIVTGHSDISFALDNNDKPHVCYPAADIYFKYARGTFTGMEEQESFNIKKNYNLQIFPNPATRDINIRYTISIQGGVELSLYDVTGARIKFIRYQTKMPGIYQESLDVTDLASGIYFIEFKQEDNILSTKCILIT